MKKDIEKIIEIPEGIEVLIDNAVVKIKGKLGESKKAMRCQRVDINVVGNKLKISAKRATKRERAIVGSFVAHIKNMIRGVTEGHIYKLRICSGHFPMSATVSNGQFILKNFFGESVPRKLQLPEGVDVTVQGNDITVKSISKELAGQTAASIERLAKRSGFDSRVFQDGIYIYIKDGKELK